MHDDNSDGDAGEGTESANDRAFEAELAAQNRAAEEEEGNPS